MDREELFKKADEMRASPPSYFKFDNLHDLDDNADGYGLDKGRYILCGQSSGGNLALVTSMRLKDTPYKPLGQVLCYSVLDQKTDPDDKPDHCDDERKDLYRFYFQCYIGDAAPGTPEISPLFFEADDFKGLPETIMIEGGLNELKSENISLFKKLCDIWFFIRIVRMDF